MIMMVLITGACGGLGRAMAAECAQRGFALFLTDMAQTQLDQLGRGLGRQSGVAVHAKACDLTDKASVDALFAHMDGHGIKPDMLLNIAGIDHEGGFTTQTSEHILDIVRLNIEATLRVTHAALSRRPEGAPFYIVNVSSLASLYPIPLKATYAASKRFLLDFSIALGQELGHENVRVMALCPGGLATTREALLGIESQGVWGQLTTNGLERVARKTIAKVTAGKRVYIPGFVNGVLSTLGRLIPASLTARLLHRRWAAAQSRWLKTQPEGKA